jgi:LysW-gamma-L-lysine/LysW-L-ornithine aminotransferase
MRDIITLQGLSVVGTYANRGLALDEGEGVWLKDPSGARYLDLMTNYGVNIFGHGHPEITETLSAQLRRLTTLHGSFANGVRAEAARALITRCGGGLSRVYFSNSGAEAVEAALKFAVLATGRKRFVRCRSGYHGKTLGALSATDGPNYRSAFEPLLWEFADIPFNDAEALAAALDDRTAAFIVEPIQGEGGVRPASPGYLKKAAELCAARGALLVLDEIQTGTGRTGTFLASSSEVERYDIVTLGKGLAGGIPVGATLVSAAVATRIPKSSHTSTFGGSPLAAAGILAVLWLLDENMLAHVREAGACFVRKLGEAGLGVAAEVRGRGLMLGVRAKAGRDLILKELQREKILACPAGTDVVRFLPPYIISEENIDLAMRGIVRAFQASGAED